MTEYSCGYACGKLKENELYSLTEFFKSLGTPSRIRILFLLMERESCVGDLAVQLNLTQSAVSHQLNILKSNKLLRQRRDGKGTGKMFSKDYLAGMLKDANYAMWPASLTGRGVVSALVWNGEPVS